ncbi:insect cuticle protein domain-containing protein [Phthorimaea operculella]|nr:insect cuticle protein domain-containing protein [Phthorimaea operculella]
MKLVVITALIAVCGAAKLDRTYLPPASAKTAGGTPGSLQAPFPGNSLNNGLGGLPKGSYENDFQGVVVDAAAAGTRASEPGDSGLGLPRISYGSTNSKVGAAAFKTQPSAFAPQEETEPELQGSQEVSENADFQQGGFSNDGSQSFERQQEFSGSDRARASIDRSATILRYENEVGPESYHYAFETDNGISAEENGVATNGVQATGGFSYTGDDGQVYSISYTADENGYQPKGDHLPTPPPIPVEILKSLEQNARDEAAGLSDDGSYDAQRYNAGSDYADNGDANNKFTHQSTKYGSSETNADDNSFNQDQGSKGSVDRQSSYNGDDAQGSNFNAQAAQANVNGQSANRYTQGSTGFGSNGASKKQSFNAQSGQASNVLSGQGAALELEEDDSVSEQFRPATAGSQGQSNNGFGSSSSAFTQGGSKQTQARPGLGNRNEYLPPLNRPNVRPQNRPQSGRLQNTRPQSVKLQGFAVAGVDTEPTGEPNTEDDNPVNAVPLGQQDLQEESRPQQAVNSFGKPIVNEQSSQNGFSSTSNQGKPTNGRRPTSQRRPSTNANYFAQGQSSQPAKLNEYLPPTVSSPNRRPSNRPQAGNSFSSQYTQQNQQVDAEPDVQTQEQTHSFPAASGTGSQSTLGSQSQQLNSFQKPQSSRPVQNNDRYKSQAQSLFNSPSSQSSIGLSSQKATVQPATELTTPFESNEDSSSMSESQTANNEASNFNQYNRQNSFVSQPSRPVVRPQSPRPFSQTQSPKFPKQSSIGQFNQNAQLVNQPQGQNSFGQKVDAQYSSSTMSPSFTGQPQGSDDSYYYNQPSKPFGTPQASRFPSAPSSQFDRITQSSFGQNEIPTSPEKTPATQSQGSSKYPRPPVIRPTSPTSSVQSQFGNNYRKPATTRFPQAPTLAPTSPTASAQSQYQGSSGVNGITQASISPFPSKTPSQMAQGQFGSRPFQRRPQSNQPTESASTSFAQKPTQPSFTQQSTASASFSRRPSGSTSFQSQAQTFGQQTENQADTSEVENEQPVPSQQYTGEIYEYNKPAITIPPPDSTPVAPATQFAQNKPGKFVPGQLAQIMDNEDQKPAAQVGSQSSPSRPQFSAPSKPQFGQNFVAQSQQPGDDMKPFGALAQSQAMFGSQASRPTRPQFGQTRPQFGQTSPQFGQAQNSFSQSESTQDSEDGEPQESAGDIEQPESPQGPKNQFGFVSACCKDNGRKPAKNQFGAQSQFGQSSFAGAQKQPTSSFAGKGEQFGGPRPPPSFDEETGYHY